MTSRTLPLLCLLALAACGRTPSSTPATTAGAVEAAHPGDPVIALPPPDPLRETISFAYGQSHLDAAARVSLDALVRAEPVTAGGTLAIRGSTDSRGDDDLNRVISLARAKLVADYLETKGIARSRMKVVGLGEDRPTAPNAHLDGSDDPEGRARNRRVDVDVVPAPDATPVAAKAG